MKVVLFCGGFGMRLREYSEAIPKPMVQIGYRPILWHIMKYYAHFGHTDFILCLGWKADVIKKYFLNYNECESNDFVLSGGGRSVELLNSDIQNWNITFVDTGTMANIGQRLKAVEPYLEGETTFLANYADGLSDLHLPDLIDFHYDNDAAATFLTVRPTQSFHKVTCSGNGSVQSIDEIGSTDVWMNAGFFVLHHEIFGELASGEDLVLEPFRRLAARNRLFTMPYSGFFGCMDTFKEKQCLDDLHRLGNPPWEVWGKNALVNKQPAKAYANGSSNGWAYANSR